MKNPAGALVPADAAAVNRLLRALEDAWNAGDGFRYGELFSADADFVNIFGEYGKGRRAIADRHALIFGSFFEGSCNSFSVISARYVSADVILAHLRSDLRIPGGQAKGSMQTVASCLLARKSKGWEILAFHNTRAVSQRSS